MTQDLDRPEAPVRSSAARRARRKLARRLLDRILEGWEGLLELPLLWGVLLIVFGTWVLAPGVSFFVAQVSPGTIAQRDYVAPRDLYLLDREATQEKERRARDEVLPVYDFDSAVIRQKQQEIERLFAQGRRFLEEESQESVQASESERTPRQPGGLPLEEARTSVAERFAQRLQAEPPLTPLKLTAEQIALLVKKRFSPELEDRLKSLVRQVLSRGVVSNKTVLLENRMRGIRRRDLETGESVTVFDLYNYLGHPSELEELLEAEVRDWSGISGGQRQQLVGFLLNNLQPNLNFNQSETLERRDRAATAVDKVFTQVRKGQVVVRKGDEVGPLEARVIAELAGRRRWDRVLLPILGNLALLGLVAVALWLGLRGERVPHQSRARVTSEGLILLLVSLLGVKVSFVMAEALAGAFENPPFNSLSSYVWGVPFAVVALLSMLLFHRTVALLWGVLFSVLAAQLASGEVLEVLLYSLAGSMAAVFATDRFQLKQRLGLARIGLLVGLVNVLMILVLLVGQGEIERTPSQVGFDVLFGFVGGFLTAAVASFALPILESLFGITTDIKLLELANTNLPLLRRLAFEAPGTFQHSLMVANLAKAGCEAIGADAALAHTGGLYHDVGKILRPEYFIENQRSGLNPHDKLQPSMSALILISHIKDGMDLARDHHLPRSILDAIEQHHGTRKMTFFYNRAVERCDPETGEVAEEKYRYPGPRPRSRVLGVLMLADGVEAASRTLVAPTPAKLRSLIRTLVEDCLKDGQLDRTDLTLSDLKKVSEAFLRLLANLHHQRLDYPGFDFNRVPEPQQLSAAQPS